MFAHARHRDRELNIACGLQQQTLQFSYLDLLHVCESEVKRIKKESHEYLPEECKKSRAQNVRRHVVLRSDGSPFIYPFKMNMYMGGRVQFGCVWVYVHLATYIHTPTHGCTNVCECTCAPASDIFFSIFSFSFCLSHSPTVRGLKFNGSSGACAPQWLRVLCICLACTLFGQPSGQRCTVHTITRLRGECTYRRWRPRGGMPNPTLPRLDIYERAPDALFRLFLRARAAAIYRSLHAKREFANSLSPR